MQESLHNRALYASSPKVSTDEQPSASYQLGGSKIWVFHLLNKDC